MRQILISPSMISRLMLAGLALVLAALVTGCGYTQVKDSPPSDEPAEEVYYDEPYQDPNEYPTSFPALDPYGRWVPMDQFGWAWRPDVYRDWRPYYHGHWTWSDWGWTWISYEPFGWATYHYGNWVLDPYWGWVWFPGYDWSANRVNWIVYDNYVCWAPMPIHDYMIGDPWMHEYEHAWNVVDVRDFQHFYVGDFGVRDFRPTVYKHESRLKYKAPEVNYVQAQSGVSVTMVNLERQQVPGHDEGLMRVKVPLEKQIEMRELRTRTKKDYDARRKADVDALGKKPRGKQPNVGTQPEVKSKDGSTPSKQQPDSQKKEKDRGTRSKGSKDKSGKQKEKGDGK